MKTLADFLARQERTLLGRIGAGQAPRQAFNMERWVREMVGDLAIGQEQAAEINEAILAQLVAVHAVDPRIQSVKAVYANFTAPATATGEDLRRTGGTGPHMVYKLFDSDDVLLYIGITSRGPQRLVEHHRKKQWFKDVEMVLFERFEVRSASAQREADLISRYRPRYNIQHNQGRERGYLPEYALS